MVQSSKKLHVEELFFPWSEVNCASEVQVKAIRADNDKDALPLLSL